MRHTLAIGTALALMLGACTSGKGQTTLASKVEKFYLPDIPQPSEVTLKNLDEALRRFRDMNPNDTAYREMRARLTEVLYEKHTKALEEKKTAEAYGPFATAVKLFSPEEILAGDVTPSVEKMADWTVKTYSPLGDEARVMTALIVLMNLRPDDEEVQSKYETLSSWMEEARNSMDDDAEKIWEIVDILEEVASTVPVPVVTSRLLEWYKKRHRVFSELLEKYQFKGIDFGTVYMKYYYMNSLIEKTSYDILKLYTRMGRPADALGALETYRGKRGYDPKIAALVEEIGSSPGEASNYLSLSQVFLEQDWEEAMWSCYSGWKRDAMDFRFPLCIADIYRTRKDVYGAEEYFNVARSLNDKHPETYLKLIDLYREWLDETMEEERQDEAMALLEKLEDVYKAFESRWSKMEAPIEWGDIVKRRGMLEFFAGHIDESVEYLTQAGYQSDDADSLMTLGTIYMFRHQTAKALTALQDALDIQHTSQMQARWFKMLILKKMADVERIGGKKKDSDRYYAESLKIAQGLLPYIPLDMVGKLHVVEGELNYRLGNRQDAMEAFKTGVTLSKDAGTYARVLAFLAGAKDTEGMREVYHLAYTDSALEKKWKVYFSLWYLSLQKLTGSSEDPTPSMLLSMTKGKDWTDILAAYTTGRIAYDEAAKDAVTKGKNVELEFFRAFLLFEQGKQKEFTKQLKETVKSEYYSYYEVAMALEILFSMGALK
jgi:tetratricopeptide (TPR) repeat protein